MYGVVYALRSAKYLSSESAQITFFRLLIDEYQLKSHLSYYLFLHVYLILIMRAAY